MAPPSQLDHLSTWIHLVAACIFVGGLLAHLLLVGPLLRSVPDGDERQAAREAARRRLRIFVAHAVALLLLTGIYQLMSYAGAREGAFQTNAGLVLMLKMLVAVVAFMAFLFAPFPQPGDPGRAALAGRFYAVAALLGVVVILMSRWVR